MLYYIVPIYIFFIYCLQIVFRDKNKFLFLLLPAIFFILIIGVFRDITVGTDTHMYALVFQYPENIEIGYKFLAEFIKYFVRIFWTIIKAGPRKAIRLNSLKSKNTAIQAKHNVIIREKNSILFISLNSNIGYLLCIIPGHVLNHKYNK